MFEAFRVGPVETGDGNFTLYMACSPAGAVSAIAADDRSGLAELRKRAPAGAAATCEPGLAAAGAQLGFRAAALSEGAKHARATFATMLYLGRAVEPRVVEQMPQTIDVAQRFLRARPWQLVRPEVPVEITIAIGGRERRLVASVLGADEIQHGVALYESAADLARFVELAEQDRPDGLLALPYSSLTIDPEPRWVADAVEAAIGDSLVVVPVATGAGGPRAVTPEELTTLAAAMFAVTKLAPGRLAAEVTIEVEGGGQCRAMARIPARAAVSTPPLPAWAARPIPMSGPVPAAILTVPVLPVEDSGGRDGGAARARVPGDRGRRGEGHDRDRELAGADAPARGRAGGGRRVLPRGRRVDRAAGRRLEERRGRGAGDRARRRAPGARRGAGRAHAHVRRPATGGPPGAGPGEAESAAAAGGLSRED